MISNTDTSDKKKEKKNMSKKEKLDMIENLTKEMNLAAKELDFERAMQLRDIIFEIDGLRHFTGKRKNLSGEGSKSCRS